MSFKMLSNTALWLAYDNLTVLTTRIDCEYRLYAANARVKRGNLMFIKKWSKFYLFVRWNFNLLSFPFFPSFLTKEWLRLRESNFPYNTEVYSNIAAIFAMFLQYYCNICNVKFCYITGIICAVWICNCYIKFFNIINLYI